jgi:putative ABC transport system permease protein
MRAVWQRLRVFTRRLGTWKGRDTLRSELDDEMQFHQELLARDLEQRGVSHADAALAARRQFGNALSLRERGDDAWGFPMLEEFWQDVRYGARTLRKSPAFAIIAIVAIGLAIGINAGFFTLVDTFVWKPIPVTNPDRIVKLIIRDARGWMNIRFSYSDFATLSAHARTLDDVVAYVAEPVALKPSAAGKARAVVAGCVSSNYFSALGGSVGMGRALATLDDRVDAPPVIVISHAFWAREFAGGSDVVGRDVVVNGSHATIVGVAQPGFIGINPLVPDFWISLPQAERVGATPGRLLDATNRFISLRARLHPGITILQAKRELSGLVAEPVAPKGSQAELTRITGVELMPNSSILPSDSQTALMVAPALLVVALVLVIACANLANLLLSRALARQREIAVRLTVGASRRRLVRQLLTESLMITLAGASLGLVLANWTVAVVSRSFFSNIPLQFGTLAFALHASWRVVAYTVLLALISVVIFGLAPALQATSSNLTSALKGEDVSFAFRIRRSRFRNALVAVQVAGSVVLLVAAGTLAQGVRDFASQDSTGLEPRHVTVASLGLSADGHVSEALASERTQFAARVAALSGVASTARALQAPFTSWPLIDLAPLGDREPLRAVLYNRITPHYFDVVGQRLIAGRSFSADDSSTNAQVVIVTKGAARLLWPTGDAVGQSIRVASRQDSSDRVFQVVGVVSDAHSGMIWDGDDRGYVYFPASAFDFSTFDMPLIVRAEPGDTGLQRSLGDIAEAIDPNLPLHLDGLVAVHDTQIVPFRYGAVITMSVGAIGLALAIVGLYGVVAFAVRQRFRDIAVHVAMGANPRAVLQLVLRRELRLVAIGLVCGLVLAMSEAQLIASLTLPLASLGAVGFIGITLLMLLVASIATTVPALAALRIAPMQVLRQE